MLLDRDCFRRMAGFVRAAGFHLDEDHRLSLDGHEVDFTLPRPPIPLDDFVAAPPKVPRGRVFASPTE